MERCPLCSFDPTSLNDYCAKHRPQVRATQANSKEAVGEAGARLRALVAQLEQCDAELLIAERLIEHPATDPLGWVSGVRDRLRAVLDTLRSAVVTQEGE